MIPFYDEKIKFAGLCKTWEMSKNSRLFSFYAHQGE